MSKFSFGRYLSLALVLALVLTASFGSSRQAAAGGETDLGHAIAVQEAHTDRLIAIDGVIGTAVGAGSGGGHVILALTTAQGVKGIPGAVDGVIVRPLVTGVVSSFKGKPGGGGGIDPTARFDRPVPIGVSTGHEIVTAGTIGARVTDGTDLYALSNNHVYANSNAASDGDPVYQPGRVDGGTPSGNIVGNLSGPCVDIKFDGSDNVIDAAIAKISMVDECNGSVLAVGNSTPPDGYGTPTSTPIDLFDLTVTKYGRTTGQTNGQISGVNATVNVDYGSAGVARFVNQIMVSGGKFSDGGDSGSLIVARDSFAPVALLFAGGRNTTFGSPIAEVLGQLAVTIDGSGATPPTNDAPNVSIDSVSDPADLVIGYVIGETIAFTGSATYAEDGPVTSDIVWSSSIDGAFGSGGSASTNLSAGTHTITASVIDQGGKTGSDSTTIVVTNPNADTMSVAGIGFVESHRGPHTDFVFTITIVDEGGNPVSGADVTSVLSRPSNSWNFNGTTNSQGKISGKLRSAIVGTTYTVTVNNVTHSNFVYVDGPDSSADWLVGGPNP
jgi:hypothetical protein